mgnify:FL=1
MNYYKDYFVHSKIVNRQGRTSQKFFNVCAADITDARRLAYTMLDQHTKVIEMDIHEKHNCKLMEQHANSH